MVLIINIMRTKVPPEGEIGQGLNPGVTPPNTPKNKKSLIMVGQWLIMGIGMENGGIWRRKLESNKTIRQKDREIPIYYSGK